jgi:SnoaL-like domain
MDISPGVLPPDFADDHAALRWLIDRSEITETVNRFAICLDTEDWDLFRTILTDPIEMDYPISAGSGTFSLDDLIGVGSSFFGRLDATQHLSANHQIAIVGDEATCISTLHAQHYLAEKVENPVQRQIGYYTNHLRRLNGWRIWRSEQHVTWSDGNSEVYEHAMNR